MCLRHQRLNRAHTLRAPPQRQTKAQKPGQPVSAAGVGWSNVSVAGRSSPNASDSALRSSTAPRESKPDSIRGASGASTRPTTAATAASTRAATAPALAPPAVALAWPTPAAPPFDSGPAATKSEKSAGGGCRRDRKRDHLKGVALSTGLATPREDSAPSSAARPSCGPTRPMPMRSTRAAVWGSLAAMPAPAQAPHCTLTAATPLALSALAAASSAALAAP
jgi:hypothetical protein